MCILMSNFIAGNIMNNLLYSRYIVLQNSISNFFTPLISVTVIFLTMWFITGCNEKPVSTPENILTLSDATISDTIENNSGYLLIHFTSYDENCGYCADSNPYINKIAETHKRKLTVARRSWEPWKSYANESKPVKIKFNIRGIPMFILIKNDKEIWRGTGHTDVNINKIEELMKQCCS